jgi:histidine ammonia-lyase
VGRFEKLSERLRSVWQLVRERIELTDEDRPMDGDIESALDLVRGESLWRLVGEARA